jgi:protein TonB
MPAATVVSVALHAFIAILISSSVLSSVATYRSNAVTVVLTPSKQAPSDATHMASQQQVASIGDGQRPPTDQSPSTKLAILEAFSDQVADPSYLAAEVEKLQGELTQMQETQAKKNTRLGSVAARRALDADYLQRWVSRVENFGNAALANVGSARGDVRLLVVVNKLGILLDVSLLESSGFPHLDRAAIKTVQDAAPYPAFPPALGSQVDKLEIVRTWQFRP